MSLRYISERYPSNQRVLPVPGFHEERILSRSRGSPYEGDLRDRIDWNHDIPSSSNYSRERMHIPDNQIRERSISPRDRNIPSRRSQEPDLRNYLMASQYNRKRAENERESVNYNRTFKDYEMANENSDWKYGRNIDMNARMMDQESMDLRNRELLHRRDYRDEEYLFDSDRDRHFSGLRVEKFDLQRSRYSPDRRDRLYPPEPRREVPFDYRDKMYLTKSRQETLPSDFSAEAHSSEFRRGWLSPDGRQAESSDRWHRDQHYREFERESRYPEQNHPNYDIGRSDPRYEEPSVEYWRDEYPEPRYERSGVEGMRPNRDDQALNGFNPQGHGMDYQGGDSWKVYQGEDNWTNGHPSLWTNRGSDFNVNNSGPDGREFGSFSPVAAPPNNPIPHSGSLKNPFVHDASLPTTLEKGASLPKFTVLIQYLYNFNQPLSNEDVEYVKKVIVSQWDEFRMERQPGSWLPSFLECTPRHNGLAIVCANKRSASWLLSRKIKGGGSTFFAASNADTPIKKVKLFFQIPDTGITAIEALKKLHWFNRGHQIRFDHFKVLNCKKRGANLNIVALTDSWTVDKLKKKLNWRPLYEDRRIRMNLMGKKKKKAPSRQPGVLKHPENESKDDLDEFGEMDEDSLSESYDEL